MKIPRALIGALLISPLPARAADAPLAVGDVAPAFSLPDQDNVARQLKDYENRTVVLAFYPADSTAGCTKEAHSLTNSLKSFQKRGVEVFGVSVQGVDSKKAFCEKEGITYPLLADVGGAVATAYGVYDPQRSISRRATYVIAPGGKIAHVDTAVNVGSHGPDVLATIDRLAASNPTLVKAPKPTTDRPFPLAPRPGEAAPRVNLPVAYWPAGAGEAPASLSPASGKPAVLVFVSTRCPVSNAYNERMAALAKEYAGKIDFVGINANNAETADEIARHAQKNEFGFPVLKDAGNKTADAFGAMVTPEAFVLDSRGVVVYHGRLDQDMANKALNAKDLRSALDAVLANRPVAKTSLNAFGCGIKREKAVSLG